MFWISFGHSTFIISFIVITLVITVIYFHRKENYKYKISVMQSSEITLAGCANLCNIFDRHEVLVVIPLLLSWQA